MLNSPEGPEGPAEPHRVHLHHMYWNRCKVQLTSGTLECRLIHLVLGESPVSLQGLVLHPLGGGQVAPAPHSGSVQVEQPEDAAGVLASSSRRRPRPKRWSWIRVRRAEHTEPPPEPPASTDYSDFPSLSSNFRHAFVKLCSPVDRTMRPPASWRHRGICLVPLVTWSRAAKKKKMVKTRDAFSDSEFLLTSEKEMKGEKNYEVKEKGRGSRVSWGRYDHDMIHFIFKASF